MRQLSGHDASFLYSDTAHANANATFVQIYDQSTAPGGTLRFKTILAHIESRLHRSPVFRSKLKRVPLELDYPYWVDDEHFDLEYHVRHIALPAPGDWRQFCIQASRIHARALDVNRPLWEIYVIEGLDAFDDLPKGSFALLTKIHHAAIDVESHHEIIEVLHDTTRRPPKAAPPAPWFPERAPGALALMARGAVHSMLPPRKLMAPFTRLAPAAMAFARDLLATDLHTTTRFNSVVSPHRVFDTRRFLVGEFKRICALVPGATVNDAVLAVCGGGLQRYLDEHGELPSADLATLAPAPGREVGASAARHAGPAWLQLQLGTHLADPVQRLSHIQAQTAAALARTVPTRDAAADADDSTPAATLAVTRRLFGRSSLAGGQGQGHHPAACTLTHVPGPAQPLYLSGARLSYFSAILPIADGMGLVFAVTQYDGRVVVSPTSCRELMPDPQAFTQCVRDSFQELLALADATPAQRAAVPQPAPKPRVRSAAPRASAAGTRGPKAPTVQKAATAPRAVKAARPRSTTPPR
jgi:WS/DGAT/MGAT family acyltransferase